MKRLVDTGEHSLQDGLRAAQDALGSDADVARLREKLGALPSAPPPPSTESAIDSKTDASHAAAKHLSRIAKLAVTGAVIGAAVIGVQAVRDRDTSSRSQAAPAVEKHVPTHVLAPASAANERSDVSQVAVDPRPVMPTQPAPKQKVGPRRSSAFERSLVAPPPEAPERTASTSASSELRLLESAQDAIDQSPRRALSFLDEHTRSYPAGNFVQERESLAIEALRKLGQKTQAIARAQEFVARFPKASNTKHLQAWLEETRATGHKIQPEPLPTP